MRRTLILLLLVSLSDLLFCQVADTVSIYRIETEDGNIFVGKITGDDPVHLFLRTDNLGLIRIPKEEIRSQTALHTTNKVGREYWLPNPQSTRYYWSPNGYGLEKGTAYYQNIWVLYNQVSVGLTDNFSIGAGMIPMFLFGGTASPAWIIPKFSIPVAKDRFNIGTGALIGTVLGENTGAGPFGLVFGTATMGSRDKNVSFGLSYGFAGDEWMEKPIINFSGMFRVSRKGYVITENYLLPVDGEIFALLSLGGRSIIRNAGIDYSLWIPLSSNLPEFVAMPYLGINIPIGKRRSH